MEIVSGRKKLFDTKGPLSDNVIKNSARDTVKKKNMLIQSMGKRKNSFSRNFSHCVLSHVAPYYPLHLHHPGRLELTFFMYQSTILD